MPAVCQSPSLSQQTFRSLSTLVSDLLANPLALASTSIESQDLIKPQMLSLPLPNSKGDLISRDASTLGSPSSIPIPPPISPSVTPNSGPCSLAEPPLVSPMVPIGLEPVVNAALCSPRLDMYGLCHCKEYPAPHVPVLVPMNGRVFPACRDEMFRAMYIDDSVLAATIRLDKDCVPLLPTLGPVGRMGSCNLGVPGMWFSLQHRLRDIACNVASIGMKINEKKTTLMIFNEATSRQFIPFCSLTDGNPLPVVRESRLLGLVLDNRLSWWPMTRDIVRRARCKVWSLVKLREAGANRDQLLSLYVARVRSTLEDGAQVYDCLINESQAEELECVQRNCLQIILGRQSRSYSANLSALGLTSLSLRRKHLVKMFAISCYRSPIHRWWFSPHPPMPLNTRYCPPASLFLRVT